MSKTLPKILLLDDEPSNLDALERLFRKHGEVLKCQSGSEALEKLREHSVVEVMIVDQKMPGMTGVEFLEKSLATHPDSVRILLTGYTDSDDIISAINRAQIYRYIHKPWEPLDLTRTLEEALEKFRMQQEIFVKNRELQALDQAKNNFMILVNHELKTPLTALVSFAELLSETNLDFEQKKYLDRVSQATQRLREIVDDVMVVVRAQTNTLKMNPQKLEIKLFASLADNFQKLAEKKNVRINTDSLLTSSESIYADAFLLKDVLHKLIHNAIKYAEENSSVDVKCETLLDVNSSSIEISIFNKGPNISSKTLENLHRAFFLDEEILHHSSGLGLGLHISSQIARLHRGKLIVENRPDGVRVAIQIPVSKS